MEYDKKTENLGNQKHLLHDLKNDEENLKNVENLEMSTVGPVIWREN